jgi:hypothetical protein
MVSLHSLDMLKIHLNIVQIISSCRKLRIHGRAFTVLPPTGSRRFVDWSCCISKYSQLQSKIRQSLVLYQPTLSSRDQRVSSLLERYVSGHQTHLLAVVIPQRSRWPPAPPHRRETTGHSSRLAIRSLFVMLAKSISYSVCVMLLVRSWRRVVE